jgi:N-acetylmuramoyl-L-alanine amidase
MRPKNMVVTRIRTSHSGDGLRVTLDCDGASCYAVASPPGKPRIIQIEVSEEAIEGGVAIPGAQKGVGGKSAGKGRKKPSSQDEVMEQLGLTVRTIILDAGHGGKDPGAMAGDIEEARFTLAMAKRIGALLKKEGFSVLYTRSGNKFISLQDRPDIANSKKADLFISIHANANPNPAVRGIETYFLDSARTQDAAVVAARENSVSVKNISDLQVILTDLMLSSKLEESRHLAKCVQKGLLNNLRAGRYETVDNGHRSAPFYVLMGARMPAVLVEFGYITNKDDAENMRSERYLQLQAAGVVDGIKQYKNELSRIAGK